MYANGQGVEQSFTTAREWCAKAAAQGDENAIKELKRLDERKRRQWQQSRVQLAGAHSPHCHSLLPPSDGAQRHWCFSFCAGQTVLLLVGQRRYIIATQEQCSCSCNYR